MDAGRVRELQAFLRRAGRAAAELQQQPVAALDDGPSLGNPHVTDGDDFLRGALRTEEKSLCHNRTVRTSCVFVMSQQSSHTKLRPP